MPFSRMSSFHRHLHHTMLDIFPDELGNCIRVLWMEVVTPVWQLEDNNIKRGKDDKVTLKQGDRVAAQLNEGIVGGWWLAHNGVARWQGRTELWGDRTAMMYGQMGTTLKQGDGVTVPLWEDRGRRMIDTQWGSQATGSHWAMRCSFCNMVWSGGTARQRDRTEQCVKSSNEVW